MSIAVTTVVLPSKRLTLLIALFCIGLTTLTWYFFFTVQRDIPIFLRLVPAFSLTIFLVWLVRRQICYKESLRIDISEHGEIRLAEDTLVTLLPDSTIWPHLMVLRLRAVDQASVGCHRTKNVLVLPDCMSTEDFRALSVTCRWIAAQSE